MYSIKNDNQVLQLSDHSSITLLVIEKSAWSNVLQIFFSALQMETTLELKTLMKGMFVTHHMDK